MAVVQRSDDAVTSGGRKLGSVPGTDLSRWVIAFSVRALTCSLISAHAEGCGGHGGIQRHMISTGGTILD